MDLAAVYQLVSDFLAGRGAPVAVVGGLALHGHGITRATLDLDLVCEAEIQDALVGFLEAEGYETLHRSAGFSFSTSTMRSDDPSEPLDLERGLPTSREDVAALWRLKTGPVTTHDYLAFLASLPAPSHEALRARPGPRGVPFTLEG